MDDQTPILLLGYNRPNQLRGLINSIAPLRPKLVLLAVDGPKENRANDHDLVRETKELAGEINWNAKVRTRFRDTNLGLRRAVVDAVTWASSEYGKVVVLEDDVRAGPQLLEYFHKSLDEFRNNQKIAHVNGYNLVPQKYILHPEQPVRLTIYPESYAWATWDRAWNKYDDNLTWARNASIKDLARVCGSNIGALRWKQNFALASSERIDTWAFRWLATMWEQDWLMVSPNRNLARYEGWQDGTHTLRSTKNRELVPSEIEISNILQEKTNPQKDELSDSWLGKNVFGENLTNVIVESSLLLTPPGLVANLRRIATRKL